MHQFHLSPGTVLRDPIRHRLERRESMNYANTSYPEHGEPWTCAAEGGSRRRLCKSWPGAEICRPDARGSARRPKCVCAVTARPGATQQRDCAASVQLFAITGHG